MGVPFIVAPLDCVVQISVWIQSDETQSLSGGLETQEPA
jgi:hypothetical protein